jgi:hypothetical protein
VGRARWYFLIDGDDISHAVTHRTAEAILDGSVPESVPRRDGDGVLLATVGLRLEDGVPSAIEALALFPLAAKEEGQGRPISPIGPAVAENLRRAIRAKLNRRKVQRLERIEEAPCTVLKGEILAGRYLGWVYSNLLGTARQRMYRAGGCLRLDD